MTREEKIDSVSKHPKALFLLFFTEMWERFSYYGMRALLSLYLVTSIADGGLGWNAEQTGHLYGIYTGLVYVLPLLGGYLADRYLGFRNAVILGAIIMVLGHGSLAVDSMVFFYTGLGLLILGNGFFKPNISSMVGQLYPQGSPLKDSAYTIFYMGINIGAFAGSLLCGYLGEKVGWHVGFGAAGVGMLLGLVIFISWQNLLGKIGLKPPKKVVEEKKGEKVELSTDEKQRLLVILVLSFFTIVFWTGFEQAGSSMNIFALNYVDRTIFDFEIPASWFQSVNAFLIFTLAPVFSALWVWLAKKDKEPSGPVKFSFGLFFLGLGFLSLVIGTLGLSTGNSASVNLGWLLLAYLFHTIGELCLSPVGLSYVSKLSPVQMIGLIYGVWFLASAIGNYTAGFMTGYMEKMPLSDFFGLFVIISLIAGIILLLLNPVLKKWMHGIK